MKDATERAVPEPELDQGGIRGAGSTSPAREPRSAAIHKPARL